MLLNDLVRYPNKRGTNCSGLITHFLGDECLNGITTYNNKAYINFILTSGKYINDMT